jgi:hypothetical protein
VVVQLAVLKSYENMGKAKVVCTSGCTCNPSIIDGHHLEKNSQILLHSFAVRSLWTALKLYYCDSAPTVTLGWLHRGPPTVTLHWLHWGPPIVTLHWLHSVVCTLVRLWPPLWPPPHTALYILL